MSHLVWQSCALESTTAAALSGNSRGHASTCAPNAVCHPHLVQQSCCLWVHCCSGLIQQHQWCSSQQAARHTHQLGLTTRQGQTRGATNLQHIPCMVQIRNTLSHDALSARRQCPLTHRGRTRWLCSGSMCGFATKQRLSQCIKTCGLFAPWRCA